MASRLIPDFAEADSPAPDWSLSLSNQLRARLEDKAAALRVGKGKGSLGDYLRTAARVPGALITNLADSAVSGLTLPGDVYTGKTKVPLVPSSAPEASNELMRRALDLTGTMASGTLAAPRGAIGSGAVRRFKPGDKAVKIGDKVYTDPAMHVGAVEEAALEKGYKSLDEAVDKDPVFEGLDENNFGTIDDKGKFVPDVESKVSHSDMGSVTFEDYMSERSARKYDEDNGSEFFAGGKGSVVPGLAVLSDPFYSHLERVVSRGPASASPEQWLATIRNGGVKSEELEWSGVDKALAGKTGPVSKEELAAMVKGAKPEIKEVVKKGSSQDDLDARFENGDISEQEYEDLLAQNVKEAGPKFSQYQLPGGENYREVLLTMPSTEYNARVRDWAKKEGINDVQDAYSKFEQQFGKPFSSQDFRSSHWDEPNVLVHMRLNDRDIGGRKTLFAEEIQSDWHQKGRKEGYKGVALGPEDVIVKRVGDGPNAYWESFRKDNGRMITRHPGSLSEDAALREASKWSDPGMQPGVPDAPFKKTWPDLALKRMVREAAEKGYDQVAWTDGATQADRYDLSKQVRSINWKPDGEGDRIVTISPIAGNDIEFRVLPGGKVTGISRLGSGTQFEGKSIHDVVGKDIGDRVTGEEHGDLSGNGLKVGGEGMKGFYDKILPAQANKLFGKYGAKVERGKVGEDSAQYHVIPSRRDDGFQIQNRQGEDLTGRVFNTREEADTYAQEHLKEYIFNNKKDVHVLPITPELRRAALSEGFPLFLGGVPLPGDPDHRRIRLTPVEHTPTFTEPANGARMSAQPAGNPAGGRVVRLTPVEHDPFAT